MRLCTWGWWGSVRFHGWNNTWQWQRKILFPKLTKPHAGSAFLERKTRETHQGTWADGLTMPKLLAKTTPLEKFACVRNIVEKVHVSRGCAGTKSWENDLSIVTAEIETKKTRVIASTLPTYQKFAKDTEENVIPATVCFRLFWPVSPAFRE